MNCKCSFNSKPHQCDCNINGRKSEPYGSHWTDCGDDYSENARLIGPDGTDITTPVI